MINLIACVTIYKNKLAIGRKSELLFRFKDDHSFFKNITTNSLKKESKLKYNIVLMGHKTHDSIGKVLLNRINLILTKNSKLYNLHNYSKIEKDKAYFVSINQFKKIYENFSPNVFVIGGSTIYNLFLDKTSNLPSPAKLYITHVQTNTLRNLEFTNYNAPDIFMNNFDDSYKLIGYSQRFHVIDFSYTYRILYYDITTARSEEYKYLDLMNSILEEGNVRNDRTDIGTISKFGNQIRFNISDTIPLITTKYIPFKTILEELLWMCRGDSDSKILQKKGITIWNGNTSREFLDKNGLIHYPEGTLGPQYGFLWRHFGAKYKPEYSDTSKIDTNIIGGFDQLKYVENLLQNDPFSRRIMISSWSPDRLHEQCLPSCHFNVQFYVTEEKNQKYLSCMFTMRSNDFFLAGQSFNMIFYTVLTYILAKKYNMKPKELIYNSGDTHIYKNHIEAVQEQLKRTCRPFPKLILNDSIKTKKWDEITEHDFEIIGYFPDKPIKVPMAI